MVHVPLGPHPSADPCQIRRPRPRPCPAPRAMCTSPFHRFTVPAVVNNPLGLGFLITSRRLSPDRDRIYQGQTVYNFFFFFVPPFLSPS